METIPSHDRERREAHRRENPRSSLRRDDGTGRPPRNTAENRGVRWRETTESVRTLGTSAVSVPCGSALDEAYNVSYEGTDTVVGRETHVLLCRPMADATPFHQAMTYVRIWVDAEYWLPLEHEAEYRLEEGGPFESKGNGDVYGTIAVTETFESVEFDTGIDASVFDFEPPGDAEEIGADSAGRGTE